MINTIENIAARYEEIAQKRAALAVEQEALAQRQLVLGHKIARNLKVSIGFAILSVACTVIAFSHHLTHAVR